MKHNKPLYTLAALVLVFGVIWVLSRQPVSNPIKTPVVHKTNLAPTTAPPLVERASQPTQEPLSVSAPEVVNNRKWIKSDIEPFVGLIPFIERGASELHGLSAEETEKVNIHMYDTYILLMETLAKYGEVKERSTTMTTLQVHLSPTISNSIYNYFVQGLEKAIGTERATQFTTSDYFSYYNTGMLSFGATPVTIRVERASPTTSRVMLSTQVKRNNNTNDAYSFNAVYANTLFKNIMPELSNKVYNIN